MPRLAKNAAAKKPVKAAPKKVEKKKAAAKPDVKGKRKTEDEDDEDEAPAKPAKKAADTKNPWMLRADAEEQLEALQVGIELLSSRVTALEKAVTGKSLAPVTVAKTAPKPAPADDEDDENDDDDIDIPGVTFSGQGANRAAEFSKPLVESATWTDKQVLQLANALDYSLDEYADEPREARRQLFEYLRTQGIDPYEKGDTAASRKSQSAAPDDDEDEKPRGKAKTTEMPVDVKIDKDGLPVSSPIIGKVDERRDDGASPHIDRDEWRVTGKFLKMHKIAEGFRKEVTKCGLWECRGHNCHDCVEDTGNIDQIADCHAEFSGKSKKFDYMFPDGADSLAGKTKKYVLKHTDEE